MLSTSEFVPGMGSQIMANSYISDVVMGFIYLDTVINTNYDLSYSITLCYFGINRQFNSRNHSRATKLTLYKALILPVLL